MSFGVLDCCLDRKTSGGRFSLTELNIALLELRQQRNAGHSSCIYSTPLLFDLLSLRIHLIGDSDAGRT